MIKIEHGFDWIDILEISAWASSLTVAQGDRVFRRNIFWDHYSHLRTGEELQTAWVSKESEYLLLQRVKLYEKQISLKKFFTKESLLFSFSLALCISIHSMVAYITLLLLFLRLVAVFIYRKNSLQALNRVILPTILSLLLASYFLIRLLYERRFFENLFWPSTPAESLYQVIRGHFSWILGEGYLFFGTFLLIAFILYLLNTIKRGVKERDFFLLVSIAVLLILSWGPSDRQFLWSALPMHTGFDNRRFALVGCLLLCVAGGIGLARLLSTREFSRVKTLAAWEVFMLDVFLLPREPLSKLPSLIKNKEVS